MSQVLLRRVLKGTGVESPIINYDDADRALRELADQLRYGESLKRSNASWVWLSVAKILRVDADRVGDLDEEEDFQWEAHDGDDDEDDEDDYEDLEDKDGESDDIEGSA
jgi:hypothetical protein